MRFCIIIIAFALANGQSLFAQPGVKEQYQTARTYMQKGDYDNADIAFKSILKQEPENIEALKDYAYLNCLRGEYTRAVAIGKFLTERKAADVQDYQLLGIGYKGSKNYTAAAKVYESGLKKYPNSGVLYNEFGELLAMDNNLPAAIQAWEAGISKDPNNANNYYNATMYYNRFETNLLWQLLYGEIFVNMESYTERTAEVKSILLDGYKKLLGEYDIQKAASDTKTTIFERAFFEKIANSKSLVQQGINPESITAARSRFILSWFDSEETKVQSYQLFQHQQYLLREGMFEAYNQWIFGAAASSAAYQVWINTHEKEAADFKEYQQSKIFKLAVK